MADNSNKTVTVITRGDEYLIPVVITQGDTVITDQNADGVKIGFDTAICSYPGGGLTFENGTWLYPLTQELSLAMESGEVDFQTQVKMGSNVITSKKQKVKVDDSIIQEVW